ncbi:GNAT family acetyltransferase [Alteraurantiacibacter aestuarii]|nr:GNAT family acetyltransferase [Alteraurantiacibacter aestuarii]
MASIRTYQDGDFDGVRAIWEEAFPGDPARNRAEFAIPAKLKVQPELLLIAEADGEIIGTAMAGYDGHRGWLYAVAVSQSARRKGIGSMLIAEAERRLAAMGCGKVNLQVRATNHATAQFYRKLGYQAEERISMGKSIAAEG